MLPVIKNAGRNHSTNWLPSILDDFFNDELMGIPVSRQFATPAVNIKESEKDYDIQIAAPGMTREDFKINITSDNELVILLEKKENKEEDEKKKCSWIRREFAYASYSQSFALPDDVNEKEVSAKMENGVLNITLPKKEVQTEEQHTRMIEIQ